jgi:hypothetical protein
MERATDCSSGENLQQNNVDAAPSARSNVRAVEVPGELGDYELLEEMGVAVRESYFEPGRRVSTVSLR